MPIRAINVFQQPLSAVWGKRPGKCMWTMLSPNAGEEILLKIYLLKSIWESKTLSGSRSRYLGADHKRDFIPSSKLNWFPLSQDLGADHKQECRQPEENWDWASHRGAKDSKGEVGQYWIYVEINWDQS